MAPIPTNLGKLHRSKKWLWVGPVCGIICMIALVGYGLATATAGLVVIASTMMVLLGGLWMSLHMVIQRKIDHVERG